MTKSDNIQDNDTVDIALLLKNPKEAYKFYESLLTDHGFDKKQIITNDSLLRYQGVTKSERTTAILYRIAALVIGIIVFTSIFVIKNSFDISITERMKQYGMLASVGATSKQIRQNVLFEGFAVGIIAVPIGILSGVFAIWITLLVIMKILSGTSLGEEFLLTLHVSGFAVAAAVIISAATIFISSLLPALKASRVSPIESIKESGSVKISSKKLNSSRLLGKILGIEGEIADKNLKRSRRKYRTTVFSIFLSVTMFVSISSMLKYGFMLQDLEYRDLGYNLALYLDSGMTDEEEINIYRKVETLDGINKSVILKKMIAEQIDGNYSDEAMGNTDIGEFSKDDLRKMINIDFYAVPDSQYREYIKKLGLSYEEANGKAIISDKVTNTYYTENGDTVRRQYNYLKSQPGDILYYKPLSGDEAEMNEKETQQIEIAKRTDITPFGVLGSEFTSSICAIVSEETMANMNYHLNGMRIDSPDTQKLISDIKAIDPNLSWNYNDYDASQRESKNMITIFSIFLYGFIGVISVIGITNVFNTITTNMTLRSREFAILKSIGMTDKEFKKMIKYESLLYGLKALAFGIPSGVLLSYFLYRQFIGIMSVPYNIPWFQIILSIIFVFLIIFLTMGYSVRKSENQNIIETIRNENI